MFQYPPLTCPTSIRVISLHPGTGEGELKASLVIEDLDAQEQDYEALSYCWGPPVFPRKIVVNGEHLAITQTLYDACIRLRLPDAERIIWADSICIDQNSTLEKNHQVRLMCKIYTQCSRGIIYLGSEANGSELLDDFFYQLVAMLNRDARSANPAWKRGGILTMANSLYEGIPPNDDARWLAFRAFLRRPWFRRLWIIQEFALPKVLVTICGHWELDGTFLPTLVKIFTAVMPLVSMFDGDSDEVAQNEIDMALVLMGQHLAIRLALGRHWDAIGQSQFQEHLKGGPFPQDCLYMMNLLSWAAICNVTDPRDRFFGLLGLAIDLDDNPSLLPDYDKSLEQVRDAYYALFFRQGYGCQLLTKANPRAAIDLSQSSWMNDWIHFDLRPIYVLDSAKLSQAVIRSEPDRCKKAVSQISDSDLTVHGFKIDQLHIRTTKCNDSDLEILDEVFDFNLLSSILPSGESFRRMALRILLLNKTHLSVSPVPEDFLDLCERYIEVIIRRSTPLHNVVQENSKEFLEEVEELGYAAKALLNSRTACFGMTKEGYYGMFPSVARAGDQIFMIDGTLDTALVRYRPETDTYIWLGMVYVHDFEEQVQKSLAPENLATIVVR